jgi:hypothetical protein
MLRLKQPAKVCISIKAIGGKMADILKDDVPTFVRDLISKEFESNNKEKGFSDKRNVNPSELKNG